MNSGLHLIASVLCTIPPSHSYRLCLTMDVWRGITYSVNSTDPLKCEIQSTGAKSQHHWREQPTNTHIIGLHVQEIAMTRVKKLTYTPNLLYCTLEWYLELKVRHTTPDIRCTELYSLTMTTKATFSQLPTTYCFHCQPCSCNTHESWGGCTDSPSGSPTKRPASTLIEPTS